MGLNGLSDEDKVAILQCMRAIAESQLIEDWEIHSRLGMKRETLRAVVSCWPNIDDSIVDSDAFLAINNCLNEICHGVYISPEEWDKWFTLTRSQIFDSYRKWLDRRGESHSGIR